MQVDYKKINESALKRALGFVAVEEQVDYERVEVKNYFFCSKNSRLYLHSGYFKVKAKESGYEVSDRKLKILFFKIKKNNKYYKKLKHLVYKKV